MERLDTSELELSSCMDKLKNLGFLYQHNANFRSLDSNTNQLATGACLLSRGSIRCQKAAVRAAGVDNTSFQKHRNAWATKANEDYDAAMLIFMDGKLREVEERQCRKGQASTFLSMGKLKYVQGLLQETKTDWTYALDLYSEIDDQASIQDVTDLLEELELELDKANFIKSRTDAMSKHGNKEQQSVKAAFHKFDADNSGYMDADEFGLLAVELGTEPSLRSEELEEGLLQLDQDGTGDISFQEFWSWWCSDKVEQAARIAQQTNLSN